MHIIVNVFTHIFHLTHTRIHYTYTTTTWTCFTLILLRILLRGTISAWVESQNKRAYGQVGFRPEHSTIDHLVTLGVIMETLYWCFVEFRKAFETIAKRELSQTLIQIGMSLEYRVDVAWLYEHVHCQFKNGYWFLKVLKQQHSSSKCALSLLPRYLVYEFINLKEIINKVAKEGLDSSKFMHEVILYFYTLMMLLYSHIIWMIGNTWCIGHVFAS